MPCRRLLVSDADGTQEECTHFVSILHGFTPNGWLARRLAEWSIPAKRFPDGTARPRRTCICTCKACVHASRLRVRRSARAVASVGSTSTPHPLLAPVGKPPGSRSRLAVSSGAMQKKGVHPMWLSIETYPMPKRANVLNILLQDTKMNCVYVHTVRRSDFQPPF